MILLIESKINTRLDENKSHSGSDEPGQKEKL